MTLDSKTLLKQVLDVVAGLVDADRIALAKRRQADALGWRAGDYLPLLFGASAPGLGDLPDFDWAEQFADPAASLYMQMRDVASGVVSGSDYVPSVRADTGVINGPTVFGAPYGVPAHTKPVCTGRVAKEALAEFEVPADISDLGVLPIMVGHTEHHRAALAEAGLSDAVGVRHCDTQGPFDIAAQARGHDAIFLDMYTDTAFVHSLMTQSVDVYIKLNILSKTLAGGQLECGLANAFWMDPGSVRLCDDSGILVSPELFAEFCAPYMADGLEPFGGGWVHYCGGVPGGGRPEGLHLHEIYCGVEGVRGLNFTTGGDWPAEVRKVIERKVTYIGGMPRGKDEPLGDYFRRSLGVCEPRLGMLGSLAVRPDEIDSAMDVWHAAQDELWG